MSGIHGAEFAGVKGAGGTGGGSAVLGRGFAGGVQLTPAVIRGVVDRVIADVGAGATSRVVAIVSADRLCVLSGRKVGGDERADLEATCLAVASEE